jgi:hypothetical protein
MAPLLSKSTNDQAMTDFEIRDPEIDAVALAERIARHIAIRHTRSVELNLDFETLAGAADAGGLDEALALIQLSYDSIHLDPEPLGPRVRPWRHPLRWFKQQAHAFAVYYVNRLGYRQMVFNSGTLQLLEHLLNEQKAEVVRLKGQVADLTERLLVIEQAGK